MSMTPQQLEALEAHGAPYPSTIANPGGRPTVIPDIPVLAVFIFLYAAAAAGNMTTFQINNRKHHKFIPSVLLFGFCMARILTCCLRIGVATHPGNVSLGIAASIFLTAGILIVYVVNLLFAQRILRARQPKLGWSPYTKAIFFLFYGLVAIFLVLVITFVVYSSYTLDSYWHQVTRRIQLGASTYFVILTAAPLIILVIAHALPTSSTAQEFGTGSMTAKSIIVAVSSTLSLLGAGFKTGVTWEPPRPATNPAWYQSRAPFYVFYFGLEILILAWLLAARIDQRFYVPDGATKRKSYAFMDYEGEELPPRPQTAGSTTASDPAFVKEGVPESGSERAHYV